MPSFCITRCDLKFFEVVKLTISSWGRATRSKPNSRAARAASGAKPSPQCSRASRQPTSTIGTLDQPGTDSPVKPMNWPVSCRSTAHSPNPLRCHAAAIRSTISSLCWGVSVAGKWRITSGSPFRLA